MPAPPPTDTELLIMEAVAKKVWEQGGLRLLPFHFGGFFDQLLLGLTICQFISYLRFIKRDRPYAVAIVFIAVAGTFAASIVLLVWMSHLFVWGFGQFLPFDETEYMIDYAAIDIAVILIVFFIDRACRLWKAWWLAVPLGCLATASLIFGCLFLSYCSNTYYHLLPAAFEDPKMTLYGYGWLGLTVACDVAITTIIIAGLWKSRTGWSHTDSIIKGVIARSCEAQVPALVLSVLTLAFWSRLVEISVFSIMLHTKVYVLGLLMTLNFRIGQAEGRGVYVSRQTDTHHAPSSHVYPHAHSVNRSDGAQYGSGERHTRLADIEAPQDKWEEPAKSEFGSTSKLTRNGRMDPL